MMTRCTPLIAGNLKTYQTSAEPPEAAFQFIDDASEFTDDDTGIALSFTILNAGSNIIKKIGIDNSTAPPFWKKAGAFLGGIPPNRLKVVYDYYLIVGMSKIMSFVITTPTR